MSDQRIINLDQTILNTVQSCAYHSKLSFQDNLRPNSKGASLDSGDLMHKLLEPYYGIKGKCADKESDFWVALKSAGLDIGFDASHAELVKFCEEVGRFWSTTLETEDLDDEVIPQFKDYTECYENEPWRALAVEEVGSRLLFEDEDWKIIYSCKTDLIAENGDKIIPWDHKTGKRRQVPHNTSNQFRGTCFVLGCNEILINKIGFQKTLSTAERFQRFNIKISDSIIQEWMIDTIFWAKLYWHYIDTGNFPRNLTSCDKYSGCAFRSICEADPDYRLFEIERNFHVGEPWDVAKVLEGE